MYLEGVVADRSRWRSRVVALSADIRERDYVSTVCLKSVRSNIIHTDNKIETLRDYGRKRSQKRHYCIGDWNAKIGTDVYKDCMVWNCLQNCMWRNKRWKSTGVCVQQRTRSGRGTVFTQSIKNNMYDMYKVERPTTRFTTSCHPVS